ncbi:hypothetical protein IE077_001016 [Cardiosporidium cionae]|uniref:Ribosome biogenesis protein NOP53 n=1 Tax=Cardiosporidium cionae TaxID=476202 RepID=A0ABQ7J642_9APIC|nr:hypothetical protein IE077_001016 [Cardiosporidium cionae]|eukprot:KAF8819444.1 hypothetical protein IE077_001016 [Cardiosporidium cionae]
MGKSKRQIWRKIDLTDIEKAAEVQSIRARVDEYAPEKLFFVDVGKRAAASQSTIRKIRDIPEKSSLPTMHTRAQKKHSIPQTTLLSKKASPTTLQDLWPSNEEESHAKRRRLAPPGRTQRVPAVKMATEGQSYHPDSMNYETAVNSIFEEEKQQKEEMQRHKAILKPLTHTLLEVLPPSEVYTMDIQMKQKALQALARGDLSQVLETLKSQKEDEKEEETGETSSSLIRQKKREKKNKTKRNKEKRHTLLQKQINRIRSAKKTVKSFGTLDKILKEMKSKENITVEKKQKRLEKEIHLKDEETRGNVASIRLGKNRFIERSMDVSLPSEMKGSLRCVKVSGNTAVECMQSLFRRGIMEPPPLMDSVYVQRIKQRQRRKNLSQKLRSKA